MANNQPIGFIDSGFGGLTVVREALKQLPNETIYFLGDSKRCPYGPRPTSQVQSFTLEMVDFLCDQGIKMLVVACNTATAATLPLLRERLQIPVVGVIDPGSRAAIKESHNNRIGVIGTQGTIASRVYEDTLKKKKPSVQVFNLACPPFVDLVESNQIEGQATAAIVAETLEPLRDKNLDTLILGCTHYPLLRNQIQAVMGPSVTLVDSGVETITDVSLLLDYFDLAAEARPRQLEHRFFTTGDAANFKAIAKQWLNLADIPIRQISLPKQVEKNQGEKPMNEKVVVLATKNAGKAKEFKKMFADYGYDVKTLLDYPDMPDVAETGTTFQENASLKANAIADLLGTMVIADDSGLMVDALDGAPGVFSARYAGEPKSDARNNAKLLAELAEYPDAPRTASFHCCLVVARPGQEDLVFEGQMSGEIAKVPQGENGFGYDPVFYIPELGKTSAQLSPEEKNSRSHRYHALQALLAALPDLLA